MSKRHDDTEEVGYSRPPKHTRFRPGHSGNPKGRPPKSKNTKTMLKDLLYEQVAVQRGRQRVRMTRLGVMVLATIKKATAGDTRAYRNIMRWAEHIEPSKTKPSELRGIGVGTDLLPSRTDFPGELDVYWKYYFEEFEEIEVAEAANKPESPALE